MDDGMWNLFAVMATLEDSQRTRIRGKFYETSGGVRELIVSKRTMPFLRGLARTHNVPDQQVPKLALGVLYVALGEWPLSNLAAGLSSTMGMPNDVAQKVAAEIEKELFAPIMLELNQFLENRNQKLENRGDQVKQAGAANVIDLKHKSQSTPLRQGSQPSPRLRPAGAGQAEHKQPPKPTIQTRKGPPLPRPGEFTK